MSGFVAGSRRLWYPVVAAIMTALVQQPLVWGAARIGAASWRAFDLTTVPPFGIPAVVSAICWGALWGASLIPLRRRWPAAGWSTRAALAALVSLATVVVYAAFAQWRHESLPEHPVLAATVGFGINAIWIAATDWLVSRSR
jgi:hypothetical protein